jgi:hypothetical protein
MRLVVSATAIYVIAITVKSGQTWGAWLYGIIALLFNPLIPIHLTRGVWQPLDFLAATALVVAAFMIRRREAGAGSRA